MRTGSCCPPQGRDKPPHPVRIAAYPKSYIPGNILLCGDSCKRAQIRLGRNVLPAPVPTRSRHVNMVVVVQGQMHGSDTNILYPNVHRCPSASPVLRNTTDTRSLSKKSELSRYAQHTLPLRQFRAFVRIILQAIWQRYVATCCLHLKAVAMA